MPLKVKRDDQTAINLTPMIDIVFLLIIFFMVSSHFTHQSHSERDIEIRVPQVADAAALTAPPRHRVINIFEDGRIAFDNETVSIDELGSRLAEAKQQFAGLGVIVRGDGLCPYHCVANVISTCRKMKISPHLAVRSEDTVTR